MLKMVVMLLLRLEITFHQSASLSFSHCTLALTDFFVMHKFCSTIHPSILVRIRVWT